MAVEKLLQTIGENIRQERLNQNFSQLDIAQKADISRRTLLQAEAGHNTSLATFIAILDALNRLSLVDSLITPESIKPMEFVRVKGKQRQRATGARAAK